MNTLFDLTLSAPLSETAIQILLFFTFELHLIFVLMMIGTAVLAMYYFGRAWWGGDERTAELRWDKTILRKFLPLKALAVILGVGPLLLIQVFYTVPFLTATSLHAPYWLMIIVFLILSLLAFDALGQKMDVHPYYHLVLGLAALVLLLAIPGVFVGIVVTAENPDHWIRLAGRGGEFFGILSIHWLMRYFHVFGAAIVFGAVFQYLFSGKDHPEKARKLFYWIIAGLCFQIVGGFALYLSVPRGVSAPAIAVLFVGISAALVLMWIVFASAMKQKVTSGIAVAVVLMFVITPMLLTRQILQNETFVPMNKQLKENARLYGEKIDKFRQVSLERYSKHLNSPMGAGPEIYSNSCAFCHGKSGTGKGAGAEELETPPENLTAIRVDPDYLREILLRGVPGAGMPYFRFYTRPQLDGLTSYINTHFQTAGAIQKTQHPKDRAISSAATVQWEHTCAVCHGLDGKRSELGLKFKPEPPDFTRYSLLHEYALKIITDGYPRTMMRSFVQLPPEVRSELASIVLDKRQQPNSK